MNVRDRLEAVQEALRRATNEVGSLKDIIGVLNTKISKNAQGDAISDGRRTRATACKRGCGRRFTWAASRANHERHCKG